MLKKRLLKLALFTLALGSTVGAFAQLTVDFSSSTGTGTSQDKVLMENVRVSTPVPNPFNPGTFTQQTVVYNVVFKFDPSTLHLVPEAINEVTNGCASLTVQVNNAYVGAVLPISGAMVTVGGRTQTTNTSGVASFTQLPPGETSIRVDANNYNGVTQATTLSCPQNNSVGVALSPNTGTGSLVPGQFRVVLSWGENPRDIDSHITGPSDTGARWHVYYSSRTSGGICNLDTDDTTSYGPETITCNGNQLRPGVYRYSVHHYAGTGNIGSSSANVRLETADGLVFNYAPPTGAYTGSGDVWTVFEVTVNTNGSVSLAPVNTIANSVSSSSVARAAPGTVRYGQPENPAIFSNLRK